MKTQSRPRWLRPACLAAISLAFANLIAAPALAAADPAKELHLSFEAADDGFDLARSNSVYTNTISEAIFESLLTYDYLARPPKLMPNTAEAMPEISEDGKTLTFKIKKGIYFTPHPAFKGKKRELVAQDYIYTIMRHMDPATRSVQSGNYDNKIVGLDELAEEAQKSGKFDYDRKIPGLEAVDSHTLRIRLKKPDHVMLYHLAKSPTGAMAREVVETYGEQVSLHPVGTGAYMLHEYVPRSKIALKANPDYRGFTWDFKGEDTEWDKKIVAEMKGKQMPQIGKVEIRIIEEEQSRWLAFSSGQLDFEMLVPHAASKALDKQGKLLPAYTEKGFRLFRFIDPGVTRTFFNFEDPIVGGYSKEKIALRRAIAMAYDLPREVDSVWYGQAQIAQGYVPPGVIGHDPSFRRTIGYNPELANKLLDRFGYKRGADGFRTMPDGKPLLLKIHSAPKSRDYARMEIWRRSLGKVGIRAEFPVAGFADNLKSAYQCKLMMFGLGGVAGVPDAVDFYDSYYGANALRGNMGCYKSAEYDKTYDLAMSTPDGPERQKLLNRLQLIMEADTVHSMELNRIRNWIIQPWVQGYKTHPVLRSDWRFLDVDLSKQPKR
ncbi:ABC transporter substrate-binding protein [Massilia sp. W12]|uniref:ABC transporter substrate-binding protein n=1 Tax=Massilia sp. W12 TaxID=3126507 RepID=UPI0030CCE58F